MPADDSARALHVLGLACVASAYGGEGHRVSELSAVAARFRTDGSPVVCFLAEFVEGVGGYFGGAYGTAGRAFPAALAHADAADTAGSSELPGLLLLAGAAALFLGDDRTAEQLNHRLATRARQMGALPLVNEVLPRLAMNHIAMGRWSSASADLNEGIGLAHEIGQQQVLAHLLSVKALLAGLRGDAGECRDSAERARELAADRRLVHVDQTARWALLLLDLAGGRYDEAYLHARAMPHLPLGHWAGPERIEAAARAGRREEAEAWLADFGAWAEHFDIGWARSATLRCRALFADESTQELALLADALEQAKPSSRPFEQARTRLAYGEALRRNGRRVEARTHLHAALDRFDELGAAVWGERAREQLRASGQTARRRQTDDRPQLTQQELQIARFVAQGLSNREVAAHLFLSTRTIEFHLRKVFAKLGITSRTQLAHVDLDPGGHPFAPPMASVER
jgi:ATP/maltotriose-dependent transcriptional regulator MalT